MRRRSDKHPLRMLVLISQLGITMMVAIAISGWVGLKLVAISGREWIFPVFLLIGCMAGVRSCYSIIKRLVSFESKESEDEEMDHKDK